MHEWHIDLNGTVQKSQRQKYTNYPNDLDLEHCNRIFKAEAHSFRYIFTEKTISCVSRSALCTDEIARNFDKQTHTKKASGIHTDKDLTEDVWLLHSCCSKKCSNQ